MTTAAPAIPQSGAARTGRRLGVRAKLMLSFAGMAAMTVAASAVGLMSFSAVERPMAQIADTSLPEMELATRLAGESGAIASAAAVAGIAAGPAAAAPKKPAKPAGPEGRMLELRNVTGTLMIKW